MVIPQSVPWGRLKSCGGSQKTADCRGGGALKNPFEYFQLGVSEEQKQEIENLIAQRTEAKKQKDFAKADEIRERLHSMGIEIMDLPTKSVWEKV